MPDVHVDVTTRVGLLSVLLPLAATAACAAAGTRAPDMSARLGPPKRRQCEYQDRCVRVRGT